MGGGGRFRVGAAVRGAREEKGRREGRRLTIEVAADEAGMSSADRWQRLEARSENLDRWLRDLDDAARCLGVGVPELLERARRLAAPPPAAR